MAITDGRGRAEANFGGTERDGENAAVAPPQREGSCRRRSHMAGNRRCDGGTQERELL